MVGKTLASFPGSHPFHPQQAMEGWMRNWEQKASELLTCPEIKVAFSSESPKEQNVYT